MKAMIKAGDKIYSRKHGHGVVGYMDGHGMGIRYASGLVRSTVGMAKLTRGIDWDLADAHGPHNIGRVAMLDGEMWGITAQNKAGVYSARRVSDGYVCQYFASPHHFEGPFANVRWATPEETYRAGRNDTGSAEVATDRPEREEPRPFQVGDRVRYRHPRRPIARIGEVQGFDARERVRWCDTEGVVRMTAADHLELVTPAQEPEPSNQLADKRMICDSGCGVTPHRYRPSPEAGPYWRCSECGETTGRATYPYPYPAPEPGKQPADDWLEGLEPEPAADPCPGCHDAPGLHGQYLACMRGRGVTPREQAELGRVPYPDPDDVFLEDARSVLHRGQR